MGAWRSLRLRIEQSTVRNPVCNVFDRLEVQRRCSSTASHVRTGGPSTCHQAEADGPSALVSRGDPR